MHHVRVLLHSKYGKYLQVILVVSLYKVAEVAQLIVGLIWKLGMQQDNERRKWKSARL